MAQDDSNAFGLAGAFEKLDNPDGSPSLDFPSRAPSPDSPAARSPVNGQKRFLIIAVVAVFVLALALFIFVSAPVSQSIRITTAGAPVPGASVSVQLDGKILATGTTDANGLVTFAELPRSDVLLKASKAGIGSTTQTFQPDGNLAQFNIGSALANTTTQASLSALTVSVVDGSTHKPIQGADVSFQANNDTGSATTDAKGQAKLSAPTGVLATFKITAANYRPVTLRTFASKSMPAFKLVPSNLPPALLAKPADSNQSLVSATSTSLLSFAGTPSVTVTMAVTTPDGLLVTGGTASLIDTYLLTAIAQSPIVNGVATFTNVDSSRTVYPKAEVPGFLTFYDTTQKTDLRATTLLKAVLTKESASNSKTTPFTLTDAAGNPTAGTVYVLSDDALLTSAPADSSGTTSLALATGGTYQAVAVSDGKLPARSGAFNAGDTVALAFDDATQDNSGTLTVTVTGENGQPAAGARVIVQTTDGHFILPSQSADSQGQAVFGPLPFDTYLVTALSGGQTGQVRVPLNANADVPLAIQSDPATVTVSATDVSTGKDVDATFESDYTTSEGQTVKFDTCKTSGGQTCTLNVKSNRDATVTASADGFVDYHKPFFLSAKQQSNVSLSLTPASLATAPSVTLVAVTDANGNSVDKLKPGGTYAVQLKAIFPQGLTGTTVTLRGSVEADADKAGLALVAQSVDGLNAIEKSSTYSPAPQCTDLANTDAKSGYYDWASFVVSPGETPLNVLIHVSDNAKNGQTLALSFRGQAKAGNLYTRTPADSELGSSEDTATKAGCYAKADSKSFPVFVPAAPDAPLQTAEFTPSLTIARDADTGKLQANQKQLTLQIDGVYGVDAIPVQLDAGVLAAPVSSTATPSTASCYEFKQTSDTTGVLIFRASNFGAPTPCPLRGEGNDVPGDESASLTFGSADYPDQHVSIPIRVVSHDVPNVYGRPTTLTPGDQSAKLIYLISERQGARHIAFDATQNSPPGASFNGAGAAVFGWDGHPDGTLSAGEGTTAVAEWSYDQLPTGSYFPGIAGICGQLSGDPADFLSGADYCLTKNQYRKVFALFKTKAMETAAATKFRRGNGQPAKSVTGSDAGAFDFYTIVQLRANVGAALDGVSVSGSPDDSLPGVYTLRAHTSDAGATWTFTASLANLDVSNYLNPPAPDCTAGSTTGATTAPLNAYLYGEKNCVKHSSHLIAASEDQQDEKITYIPIPSAFWGAVFGDLSCSAQDKLLGAAWLKAQTVCGAVPGCQGLVALESTAMQTNALAGAYTSTGACTATLAAKGPIAPAYVAPSATCDLWLKNLYYMGVKCEANQFGLSMVELPIYRAGAGGCFVLGPASSKAATAESTTQSTTGLQPTNPAASVSVWNFDPTAGFGPGTQAITAAAAPAKTVVDTSQKANAAQEALANKPISCLPRCAPRTGQVMSIPIGNKIIIFIRLGLTHTCGMAFPPAWQFALPVIQGQLMKKANSLGPVGGLVSMAAGFAAQLDNCDEGFFGNKGLFPGPRPYTKAEAIAVPYDVTELSFFSQVATLRNAVCKTPVSASGQQAIEASQKASDDAIKAAQDATEQAAKDVNSQVAQSSQQTDQAVQAASDQTATNAAAQTTPATTK